MSQVNSNLRASNMRNSQIGGKSQRDEIDKDPNYDALECLIADNTLRQTTALDSYNAKKNF